MRKIWTLVFLILLIVLSACSTADNLAPTPTDAPQADVVVETEPESEGVQHSEAICTAQAQAVENDLLQEGDWVEGAEEGFTVTIIEYGDFQ